MEGEDHDQRLLGFLGLVVFGRALTNVLQNLRTFDEQAFDEWYGPWREEMEGDELCRFFYVLRSQLLKGITPLIATVLASTGASSDKEIGDLSLVEQRLPKTHRGETIGADLKLVDLCRPYVEYLAELSESAIPVILEVQAHFETSEAGQRFRVQQAESGLQRFKEWQARFEASEAQRPQPPE